MGSSFFALKSYSLIETIMFIKRRQNDMIDEEFDMRCRIHRLEDKLLRSKSFQDQIRMHEILLGYRKRLQSIIWEKQNSFY